MSNETQSETGQDAPTPESEPLPEVEEQLEVAGETTSSDTPQESGPSTVSEASDERAPDPEPANDGGPADAPITEPARKAEIRANMGRNNRTNAARKQEAKFSHLK